MLCRRMETKVLFEEIQTFATKRVEDIFKIITGALILSSLFSLFVHDEPQKEVTTSLIIGVVICGLVSLAISKAKLIMQVRSDGIYVRFPPLQARYTVCKWSDIDKMYIRTYHPLREFGGWGIRYSPNGRAYNAYGNKGLQIIFKNGGKLLIGTQQPDALHKVLEQVSRVNHFQ